MNSSAQNEDTSSKSSSESRPSKTSASTRSVTFEDAKPHSPHFGNPVRPSITSPTQEKFPTLFESDFDKSGSAGSSSSSSSSSSTSYNMSPKQTSKTRSKDTVQIGGLFEAETLADVLEDESGSSSKSYDVVPSFWSSRQNSVSSQSTIRSRKSEKSVGSVRSRRSSIRRANFPEFAFMQPTTPSSQWSRPQSITSSQFRRNNLSGGFDPDLFGAQRPQDVNTTVLDECLFGAFPSFDETPRFSGELRTSKRKEKISKRHSKRRSAAQWGGESFFSENMDNVFFKSLSEKDASQRPFASSYTIGTSEPFMLG